MDPFIALSIVMLAVWAVGTWFDGPGWVHLLLTAGVFLLVWRIVTRGSKDGAKTAAPRAPRDRAR